MGFRIRQLPIELSGDFEREGRLGVGVAAVEAGEGIPGRQIGGGGRIRILKWLPTAGAGSVFIPGAFWKIFST